MADADTRAKASESEFYRRLQRGQNAYPGIRWVLDLLPNNPRLALAAIEAYLIAHFGHLPDGRIAGLDDAMAVIQARYVGLPANAEEKRLTFFELSPRDFERLIECLYDAMDYETLLTPPSKDGGRDIVASSDAPGKHERLQVECKLYSDHTVGVERIRLLHSVVMDQKANRGVLVTSSHFTQDARAWAERNAIELISGLELVVLLNQYFGSEWPARVDFLIAMSRLRHPDPP